MRVLGTQLQAVGLELVPDFVDTFATRDSYTTTVHSAPSAKAVLRQNLSILGSKGRCSHLLRQISMLQSERTLTVVFAAADSV